jgi:AraC-like DNA-binding protein
VTVITGHVIPRIGYQRLGPQPGLGIEVATTDETRERAECAGPHRLDFHQIALVTAGFDDHEVDFVPYSCAPGTLLWIRPGQVQRGFPPPGLSGWLIWFTPDFPQPLPTTDRLLRDPVRTVRRDLDKEEQNRLVTLITELHAESIATSPDAHLLRHLLAAVILRIRRLPAPADAPDPGHGGDIYTRFLQEIEGSYASTRQVEDYAARLGYTAKTLTRASLAATGHSAKHIVNARVLLEAKRLLVYTDRTVLSIATRLGFTEASNFGKFFTRHTGVTPLEFRKASTTV